MALFMKSTPLSPDQNVAVKPVLARAVAAAALSRQVRALGRGEARTRGRGVRRRRKITPRLCYSCVVCGLSVVNHGKVSFRGSGREVRRHPIQVPDGAGVVTAGLVSSVRSGMSSSAPARKHSAPMKVPRLVSSALWIWPVDGLM